jgi:hypothetical protein
MCFVYREQCQRHTSEQVQTAFSQQAFGSDVEQLQRPGCKALFDRALRCGVLARIEKCSFDAVLTQGLDLVLHQRDQRRHDNRRAVARQRGDLIAEGFAAPGRHQHERIATAD